MSQRPLLLMISNLSQVSREPILQSLVGNYRLWLFIGGVGRPGEVT